MSSYSINNDKTFEAMRVIDETEKQKALTELTDKINNFNGLLTMGNSENSIIIPEFKKLDDINVSDNEIKKLAEESLVEYKTNALNKINTDNSTQEAKLLKEKEETLENYNDNVKEINNNFDIKKQNESDIALNRGIARSSIIINKLEAFNKQELEMYDEINNKLTKDITSINFEIDALTSQKEQALSDFNIVYAAKLNNKISNLKQELIENQNEIIKYNNQIEQKEADFDLKYKKLSEDITQNDWNNNLDLTEIYIKYGASAVEKYKQTQMSNMINNYLTTVSIEEASDFVNNNALMNVLNESYKKELRTKYSK